MHLVLLQLVNTFAICLEYRVVDLKLVGEALFVAALKRLEEVLHGFDY